MAIFLCAEAGMLMGRGGWLRAVSGYGKIGYS